METLAQFVQKRRDKLGLSPLGLAKRCNLELDVIEEIEAGKDFKVVCTGSNKGGLVAQLGSYSVFVPAKEIRPGFVQDLTKYVGKTLRLRMIEIKKDRKKGMLKGSIIGSVYMLVSYIVFSLLVSSFNLSITLLYDIIFGALLGLIFGVIFVNFRK